MAEALLTLILMLGTMAAIWLAAHVLTSGELIERPRPKCKGKHCKNCLERGEK